MEPMMKPSNNNATARWSSSESSSDSSFTSSSSDSSDNKWSYCRECGRRNGKLEKSPKKNTAAANAADRNRKKKQACDHDYESSGESSDSSFSSNTSDYYCDCVPKKRDQKA